MKRNKLKYLPYFSIAILAIILISCGSRKSNYSEAEYAQLRDLIENESFELSNQWALPLRGGQVSLIGNPNYIRIYGDSVDVTLPYFGVRQMGGGYNSIPGFEYSGAKNDFKVIEDQQNGEIILKFTGKQNNELVNYTLTLFPGGRALTHISTPQRDNISFRGNYKKWSPKTK